MIPLGKCQKILQTWAPDAVVNGVKLTPNEWAKINGVCRGGYFTLLRTGSRGAHRVVGWEGPILSARLRWISMISFKQMMRRWSGACSWVKRVLLQAATWGKLLPLEKWCLGKTILSIWEGLFSVGFCCEFRAGYLFFGGGLEGRKKPLPKINMEPESGGIKLTIECTPNSVPMVLIVFSDGILGNYTPPKFNMEPEHDGFQKESPFPGTSFQVPC